jgi:hypothetical protein
LSKGLTNAVSGHAHSEDKRKNMTHAASFQWLCQVMDVYRYRLQAPKT